MKFPLDCKSESHFATSVDCYYDSMHQHYSDFGQHKFIFQKNWRASICSIPGAKKEKQMSSEKWSSLNNEQTKSKFRNTYQIG